MKKSLKIAVASFVSLLFLSCSSPETADLVIYGGKIYTALDNRPAVEAVAVSGERIIYAGKKEGLTDYTGPETEELDLQGKTMTPGFIDAHAHLLGIGFGKMYLDLSKAGNYDEMIAMVKAAADTAVPGSWILGRGWHQSKWNPRPKKPVRGFQTHEKLSEAVPDHPVYLTHASGHAIMVNAAAMKTAGITDKTPNPPGGEIIRDEKGKATGIFTEDAEELIRKFLPQKDFSLRGKALQLGIEECLANGLTGICTAGGDSLDIAVFRGALEKGKLPLRLYVMLTGTDSSLMKRWFAGGPEIGTGDDHLTIRAVKMYADGALGSRGAWLLEPYADRPGYYGEAVTPMEKIERISELALQHGFQVGTHAIGDRANREVLNAYEAAMKKYPDKKDVRFRIEHAQHLNSADIPRFAGLGVLPLMQAIHMASDMPWAIKRLGPERIAEGAYVWRKLLDSGSIIANGTDSPVEPVNPVACFYAAVTRRTLKGEQMPWFHPEQKMTRQEALKSYTVWAAYSQFDEKNRGTIEAGKYADFTIFSGDIMTVPEDKILSIKPVGVIIGGKRFDK
jgi:predicted amidohydrolase YtcJ